MIDRSASSTTTTREMMQSYVVSNTMPVQQRSYISSSLVNDSFAFNDDLRKSRIQNLPNYKKTNLGQNIQFIVVFQTIEIERLSNEVEILRVKLRENERQIFNYQNYEIQIRELTEKCFALQNERELYRDQIDRCNKICENLFHQNEQLKFKLQQMDFSLKQKYEAQIHKNSQLSAELEKWKNRYQASEKSKQKELEDLRNLMESQRKSMIDRQIRQVQIKFENQRSTLQNQIRKLREIIESRNRQIEDYKQRVQRSEVLIVQLKQYETMIGDYDNKIILVNQQLMRANSIIKEKEEELNRGRQREHRLSQQIKEQQQWEHENKQLRTTLQNRLREIQEWKIRSSRLEEQANKARDMIHYNDQLNNKLQVSSREIERINNILRAKLDQAQQWKAKVQARQNQLQKLRNVENQLANHATRYGMLQAENDRINNMLKSKQGQIQQWKGKHIKLQSKVNGFVVVEQEKANIQNRLNDQVRAGEEMQFLIKRLEKDISSYKIMEQNSRGLELKLDSMVKQIERLNNNARNHTNQKNDFITRYSKLESTLSEYKNIQFKMRQLQNKIALLTQENSRLAGLNNSYKEDIAKAEQQRISSLQQINHYKSFQIKITENENVVKRLNDQINKLRQDNQNWQRKVREGENRCRQFQNHLFTSNQDKQKLNNMIKTKSNEYDLLRGKYAELQTSNRRIQEYESIVKQQYNQMLTSRNDYQKAMSSLSNCENMLKKEQEIVNQLSYRVIVLSCEIERLMGGGNTSGGLKSREYQQLKQSYSRLQSKMTSKNNQIDILLSKVTNLESRISQLSQQFQRLLVIVQKCESENQQMNLKIEEYQDYARRIHILGAEIDRLQNLNKLAEEDNKKMRLRYADGLSIDKKIEDFSFMQVIMAVQIQHLRSRVEQKDLTVDEMRKSILAPIRNV